MNFNYFNNFNENMENHIHCIHIRDNDEEDIQIITNKIYNHFCRSYSLNNY